MTDVAPIGHNRPPESTPFEAIKVHLDDLLVEARVWADGTAAENQAQADAIGRLLDLLREGERAAEEQRVIDKKPLDDQVADIQARYNEYIAPKTNKKPGKITNAVAALLKAREPWLKKLEDDRKAEAARLQKIADDEASRAREALQAAQAGSSLDARDEAEEIVNAATQAQLVANRAAKPVATGLRTFWVASITEQKAAMLHYMRERPQAFLDLTLSLAQADVRAGKRQIPGVAVTEDKRAA